MSDASAIRMDDVWRHIDRALDGMIATLESLGDELACTRPALEGANSAYALVTHCCGVMEFWGGQVIADRAVTRDRDAEFVATGSVADLVRRVRGQRQQLERDLAGLDAAAAPRGPLRERDKDRDEVNTQGGVVLHIYEELAQHRGHLDLTADLVRTAE